MRPPEFTGGNSSGQVLGNSHEQASMRPPEFTGGNSLLRSERDDRVCRFNEAAGIHRRKRKEEWGGPLFKDGASMRPPEFTGGNSSLR